MYVPSHDWHTLGLEFVKRQQGNGIGDNGGGSNDDDGGSGFPQYVVILIVVFFAVAIGCTLCVRINQRSRRRMMFNQYANGNDPLRPIPRPGFIPGLSLQNVSLRPPPRARRRPSQASVTSLPVYMENPGAQEVVLLQTVAPKVEEGATNQNNTTADGTRTANGTANGTTNANANVNADESSRSIPVRSSTTSPPPDPFQETQQRQQFQPPSQSNNPFRASIESNFTHEQGQGMARQQSPTSQLRPTSPLSTLPEGTAQTHDTTSPSAIPLPPSPSSTLSPSRQASQPANPPNL